MSDVIIRPTAEDDWQAIRGLRLEMIRDTPHGFAERLEDAERHDEHEWRLRGRRGLSENSTSMVAIDRDGTWVGAMGGWIPDPHTGPLLVGVYVAPTHRGRSVGVADQLLNAVERWAGTNGSTLRLTVHESNKRARAFYTRRGYELTGSTTPYTLDPKQWELEMIRTLSGS